MSQNHMAYLLMVAGTESLDGGNTDGSGGVDNGTGGEGGGGENTSVEAAMEEARADAAEAQVAVEQAAAAVEQAATALESHEEAMEELHEEVAGVESMLSGRTAFTASGFADRYNRCARLNTKLGGRDFNRCGAESLTDLASARLFSVAGVEGFMDTLKAGANKAIEFIKGIFNAMISFFVGLKNTADGIERKAKTLSARLKDAELKPRVKLGGWNVGCDYAQYGLKGVEGILSAGVFDLVSNSLPVFMDMSKKLDGVDLGSFRTAYGKVTNDIKDLAKATGKPNVTNTKDKTNVLMVHAGFRFFATFDEKFDTEESAIKAARSIKISFGKTDDASKYTKGDSEIKAQKPQLEAALKGVDDYVSELRSSKVSQKFSTAERDRVLGTLNVAIKSESRDNDEGNEAKKKARLSIDLCKAIYSTASGMASTIDRMYIYLANQLIDAVKAHI